MPAGVCPATARFRAPYSPQRSPMRWPNSPRCSPIPFAEAPQSSPIRSPKHCRVLAHALAELDPSAPPSARRRRRSPHPCARRNAAGARPVLSSAWSRCGSPAIAARSGAERQDEEASNHALPPTLARWRRHQGCRPPGRPRDTKIRRPKTFHFQDHLAHRLALGEQPEGFGAALERQHIADHGTDGARPNGTRSISLPTPTGRLGPAPPTRPRPRPRRSRCAAAGD